MKHFWRMKAYHGAQAKMGNGQNKQQVYGPALGRKRLHRKYRRKVYFLYLFGRLFTVKMFHSPSSPSTSSSLSSSASCNHVIKREICEKQNNETQAYHHWRFLRYPLVCINYDSVKTSSQTANLAEVVSQE